MNANGLSEFEKLFIGSNCKLLCFAKKYYIIFYKKGVS